MTGTAPLKTLWFLFCAFFLFSTLRAQEEQELEEELEEEFELMNLQDEQVVFSASRHKQNKQLSPSSITVITRKQIETLGAFSIVDIFRNQPGMEVILVSPGFTAVNARMPTTYENHLFLVLVDGRQANIWLWGQTPWELQSFSIDDIERIEIIRGPASAMYGANAFAGVISVTTRSAGKDRGGWLHLEGGQWSWLQTAGRISTSFGELSLSASAGYDYAGEFGVARQLGKEIVKARALAEYRSGPDFGFRFDSGWSRGFTPTPTSLGRLKGSLDSAYSMASLEWGNWHSQVNFIYSQFDADVDVKVEYNGLHLADFPAFTVKIHDLEFENQYTFPRWWEKFVLIGGLSFRSSWLFCDRCLDGEDFSDPTSFRYHQLGTDYSEIRAGAYLHAELQPWDWLLVMASGRVDYNTNSGFFFSPRLATVAEPANGHFLRLSLSRAFRKLTYLERHLHAGVTFPEDSPLKGGDQVLFQEFMSRVVGNESLPDETLVAVEAGYEWVPQKFPISVGACAYINFYGQQSTLRTIIKTTPQGLPDLRNSTARFELDADYWIVGWETFIKYSPLEWLIFRAAYTWRRIMSRPDNKQDPYSAQHLASLGGEFSQDSGFIGSLYFMFRDSYLDRSVDNPRGLLEPLLVQEIPFTLLSLARLGYRMDIRGLKLETGLKLSLPIDLSNGKIGFREHGGGVTPEGKYFGGTELQTAFLFYVDGSL